MVDTLTSHLSKFDPTLPLERALTIPSAWYFDDAVHEAERAAVFRGTWQAVGRTDQVAKPGQFFTADVAGEPIVVTRDKTGELRAFTNVCRHRAARVVPQAEGTASWFQCRYHGWTYDLAGNLKGTPEFQGVCDFEKKDQCLPRWHVATWGPIVFAHAGVAPESLETFLSPLPHRTEEMGIAALKFVSRREYEIGCNWKVFVDNYLDGGYHVNTLHPALAGVIDYAHYRTDVFENASVQTSPLQAGSDPEIARVRSGMAYYWWVFPNLMINSYAGVLDTNLVLPIGPDRCRVIFDFYFANTETEGAQKYIDDSLKVAHQVQLEDLEICEEVQRGLKSSRYDTGRFSVQREIGGYHFQRRLAAALKGHAALM